MCDYSLEHVTSRAAAVADRLVTTTFPNTITRGFTAADDVNIAVCLRPGTEIAFEQDAIYEHPVTHRQTLLPSRTARFRQIDLDRSYAHHDALEFASGDLVPLTKLLPGQRASVLQLPATPLELPERTEERAPPRSYEII